MTGTTTTASPSFGALLRRYRERAGLSQEELAERAGLTGQAISALERAERQHPYPATVRRLADALGLAQDERTTLLGAVPPRGRHNEPPADDATTHSRAPTAEQAAVSPDFPPLPTPLTPLLGREGDLARASALLRQGTRLLTLTGPGGVGKTRLALQLAALMQPHFTGGVAFVTLAPLTDPGLVMPTIAQVLGVRDSGGEPVVQHVARALSGRHTLLVLDNCEHVLDGASAIAPVLEACPELVVLATSRMALRVRGEQEYLVEPLALPVFDHALTVDEAAGSPAVRLFVERAQAASLGFSLTGENVSTVAAICGRLDGLPLALELAAPRIKLLSPHVLLERLHHSLPLLTGGGRDVPARQQTLRGTIDWSYALLDPQEQRLFAHMAVFTGGCTFEAAEAICAHPGDEQVDMLTGLGSLVDKNLLQVRDGGGGERRLAQLETIREYALERLQNGEDAERLRRRHAEYYLALAEEAEPQLRGPEQERWLARLETEHDNLRAALGWAREQRDGELGLRLASALGRFWDVHGHLSEGRAWLEAALTVPAAAPARPRAAALNAAGYLAFFQADFGRAEAVYEEALALWRELGDRRGIAASLNNLGALANRQGDFGRAVTLLEEALALWRELGDQHNVAGSLNNLGTLADRQGNLGRALALFEEALALQRGQGDRHAIAVSFINLGTLAYWQGDLTRAATLLEEALALASELGDPGLYATIHNYLGYTASRRGDPITAATHYRKALQLCIENGDRFRLAYVLEAWAWTTRDQGDGERAAQLYGAAAALRSATDAALAPHEARDREQKIGALRESLGAAAFERGWAAGQRMLPEEAAALALEEGSAPAARDETATSPSRGLTAR